VTALSQGYSMSAEMLEAILAEQVKTNQVLLAILELLADQTEPDTEPTIDLAGRPL